MAADQHANILVFWFWTKINIEHITNQKEMAFSLWKVGKLRGKQKWLQMAFHGTGECWKLGSGTTVTLLVPGTVLCFMAHSKYILKECLHKLSTEQGIVIFSPNTDQHPKQQCNHHHRNIPNSFKTQTWKRNFLKTITFATFKFTYCSDLSHSANDGVR